MKLLFFLLVFFPTHSCSATCPLALASYFIAPNQTLTFIANLFNIEFGQIKPLILPFNKNITSQDVIIAGTRVNIPFSCDQFTNNSFLSHTFTYTTTSGDVYNTIARSRYANLTTAESLAAVNSYPPTGISTGASLNVSVNCSCGNEDVSPDYGLFLTYPLRSGDDISSVAKNTNFTDLELLRKYNPSSDFKSGIVFVPAKDQSGNYPPFLASRNKGISGGAIAGIIIAVIILLLGVGIYLYFGVYKKRKAKKSQLIPSSLDENSILRSNAATDIELSSEERNASMVRGFTVDKSVEFSYEELAKATNDFSMTHKIGEGGFGAVYYAELRGEVGVKIIRSHYIPNHQT